MVRWLRRYNKDVEKFKRACLAMGRQPKNEQGENVSVKLGRRYQDVVTRISGVCTAHTKFFTGADRACLEYVDGRRVQELWVDVDRLLCTDTGGPDLVPPGPPPGQ
jgi:hypothetical protein